MSRTLPHFPIDRVRSISDFKRDTTPFLEELRESGLPTVLTVNGKAEIIVQDARAYQRILDLISAHEDSIKKS